MLCCLIRFCLQELALLFGAQLLLACFVSEEGLLPSLISHPILLVPVTSLHLPPSEDLGDLLWLQRKLLKVFCCVIISLLTLYKTEAHPFLFGCLFMFRGKAAGWEIQAHGRSAKDIIWHESEFVNTRA